MNYVESDPIIVPLLALFRNHLSSKVIEDIRSATNKAWVLGADRFRKKMEKLADRRVSPLPKGRPKKV